MKCPTKHLETESFVFDCTSTISSQAILKIFEEKGFVVLRNLFSSNLIDDIRSKIDSRLQTPSVAGSAGYSVIDYPRKMLTPSTIVEGKIVDILVDNRITTIIESFMQSECVLAETGIKFDKGRVGYEYFPMHCDYWDGWSLDGKFTITKEELSFPVAVGKILYLHDTVDGCFCYLEGSHKFTTHKGDLLKNYSKEEIETLSATKVPILGKKGDVILFDSRGFHGPDQPSNSDRLAIISRFYRIKSFGHVQASPIPLWTSDIAR
ncbi:MAG: phytanoyl-CoA dioxygenase family protein [Cyanobacteria bacterium J06649_11]